MRIVAGTYRGRRLNTPDNLDIRPTTDRARETIFNMLTTMVDFDGLIVLDLFCGSGALGIEALSRGAEKAYFIDNSKKSLELTRSNCTLLGCEERSKFRRGNSVEINFPETDIMKFNLVFLDPPYGRNLIVEAAGNLIRQQCLSDDCVLVVEDTANSFPQNITEFSLLNQRQFGETRVGFFKKQLT